MAKKKRPPPTILPANLVQKSNLVYQGYFLVPSISGLDYASSVLGFNASNQSLFITKGSYAAEIKIPVLGARASLLQGMSDISEGISVGAPDTRIGGLLVNDGKLYFTKYIYYDANNEQVFSHFSRPLDFGIFGQVDGPYRVGELKAGFYSGYLADVPLALREKLGGKHLTGNCCLNIISRTSFGPAAFSLDLSVILQAKPLVYYPADHTTLGAWNASPPSIYFGASDSITGLIVPVGFESILFFGQHGTKYCYGGIECKDPTSSNQGVHGYPYLSQVWAYSASDLNNVLLGTKQPYEIIPYMIWTLDELNGSKIGGTAYDAASGRIFVSQNQGESGINPVIHVYKVI